MAFEIINLMDLFHHCNEKYHNTFWGQDWSISSACLFQSKELLQRNYLHTDKTETGVTEYVALTNLKRSVFS
jgi:hypothetical protein